MRRFIRPVFVMLLTAWGVSGQKQAGLRTKPDGDEMFAAYIRQHEALSRWLDRMKQTPGVDATAAERRHIAPLGLTVVEFHSLTPVIRPAKVELDSLQAGLASARKSAAPGQEASAMQPLLNRRTQLIRATSDRVKAMLPPASWSALQAALAGPLAQGPPR